MKNPGNQNGTPASPALDQRVEDLERCVQLQERQILHLERERQKFAALVNHTDVGFIVVNPEFSVRWANAYMIEHFGFAPDAQANEEPYHRTLFGDSRQPGDPCPVGRALETGSVQHDEYRVRVRGIERFVYVTAIPLRNRYGDVDEVMVMVQDMTDLEAIRRSERELRGREREFRLLSASAPVGIFRADETGETVYTNRKWTEISGRSAEESRGFGFLEAIHPGDRKRLMEVWGAAVKSATEFDDEHRIRRLDGEIRWVHVRAAPQRDDGDRLIGYVGTIEDITESRRSRERLERARNAAEDASRAKTEFLANMSHEIRTPMNGVIGMTGILLDTNLDAGQKHYAEQVLRSARSLLSIINDILDYAKLESGRMTMERVPFDLRELVEDVASLLSSEAADKQIGLGVECCSRIPQWLVGDPTRLRQVLVNLTGNAIKFTEHGHVKIRTEHIMRDEAGVLLRIHVDDTGVGIQSEQIETIFERFTQADASTTRRFGGTGLGLSICNQLVELMDGSIDVRSEVGAGSTFSVTLQLPVASDSPVPANVACANADSSIREEGVRVLLAEDNAINREVALLLLQKLGCNVEVAKDGREAVRMALAGEFDIVFMDCQMPELDGYEATRAIRAVGGCAGKVPVIALTANAMEGDRERCLASGMDDYVSKPVTRASLRDAIEHVLSASGATSPH